MARRDRKGFKVPVIMNVPLEDEQKVNDDINRDSAYIKAKNEDKNRKWSILNGNFRKVGDFLSAYFSAHFTDEVSYSYIAEQLGMNEGTVRMIISELASWQQYPFTVIASSKKKGFIQLSTKNTEQTENWMRTKARNLATGQERLWKTEQSIAGKRLTAKKRKKIKINA